VIIEGDSLHMMQELAEDSVDLIVTDPPYGYSFMGKDWDKAVPHVEIWQECLRVLKPGAFCFVMSAPRSDVQMHMIQNLTEAGFRLDFTPIYWTYASGFPKAGNIGKLVDKRLGAEREVVGYHNDNNRKVPKHQNTHAKFEGLVEVPITKPQSAEAKALDGSYAGFQPKPAVEVIIVAMKPLSEKTYVDQALANGKGITWLDDCRVPTDSNLNGGAYSNNRDVSTNEVYGEYKRIKEDFVQPQGRFPANLLVSDDVLNDGVERKTHGGGDRRGNKKNEYWGFEAGKRDELRQGYNFKDSGSYSRYFDLDKWAKTLPFLIVPKASKSEKNKGLGESKNIHPTCKPIKLMSYLITLGSRLGDTVLDPFVGSGTTCIAAYNLGRNGIGIEREPEYAEIARARLEHVKPTIPQLPPEKPEPGVPPVTIADLTQVSLF